MTKINHRILLLFIVIISSANITFSQDEPNIDASDTTQNENMIFRIPSLNHGSMFLLEDSVTFCIKKGSFQDINYTGFNEVIIRRTSFNPLTLGSFNNFNTFSAYGAMPNANSFRFNGRSINNSDLGSFNPEVFSTEFFEKAEIFYGSDAAILSDNANGVLVNFQEIRYNTAKPYSRLWFAQAGFEYLAADGIMSQNFARDWNFTFGFRNMNTDGDYPNTWMNHWNVRTILRYSPSDYSSISLVENFYNHGMGTSGGVDYISSSEVFSTIESQPFFAGADEREFRHDITLTYSEQFDSLSVQAFQTSIYLSRSEWDRNQGSNFDFNLNDTLNGILNYFNSFYGGTFSYELEPLSDNFIKVGGEANIVHLGKSYLNNEYSGVQYSMFGHLNLNLTRNFGITGGIRFAGKYEKLSLSIGGRIKYKIDDIISSFFDLSYSERIPEIFEGFTLKNEKHSLAIAGASITFDSTTSLDISGFYRSVNDPINNHLLTDENNKLTGINFLNESVYTATGASISLISNLFGFLNYNIKTNLFFTDINYTQYKWFPEISVYMNVNYQYNTQKSILRVGLQSNFVTSFNGLRYIPFYRSYSESEYSTSSQVQYINPYLYIKIGNATVRAEFENVLNANYFSVAVAPGIRRNFRLSFNWTFLEN